MGLLTTIVLTIGMLLAFWSGFYVGYIKREGKKPPVPLVADIEEVVDDVIERVRDKINKESEPQGFYD